MSERSVMPSPQLLAANEYLYQLRAQRTGVPWSVTPVAPPQPQPPQPQSAELPSHLGWGSAALTAVLRRSGIFSAVPTPEVCPVVAESKPLRIASVPTPTNETPMIKLYPDVARGLLRQELAATGRIWLLLRHLDDVGRGWVQVSQVRSWLVARPSPWRVCGWRQLRNLLRQGDGIFWQWTAERLWLRSVVRVAQALGVERMTAKPVALPVAVLLGGVGEVKAHLYASFHSSRSLSQRNGRSSPISRETLAQVTAVPARTQRCYERRIGVQVQRNLALGPGMELGQRQERAWRQGTAVFEFIDHVGKYGAAQRRYLAWQLPNSYQGCHGRAHTGRMRKINRRLQDLVKIRERGNGREPLLKLFYMDGVRAYRGKLAGRKSTAPFVHDSYWPGQAPGRAGTAAQVWFVV